jgi:hypothetical protein
MEPINEFPECCEDCKAEQVQRESDLVAKVEARARGIAKLMALGLTEEEAGALIGN